MKTIVAFLFAGILSMQAGSVAVTKRNLETIIIPQVQLQDVSFPEAIEYIRQKALASDPAKKGFNIVLQVPKDHPGLQAKVTLSLVNVPVGVALDYATRVVNLQYKADAFAVVILPPGN